MQSIDVEVGKAAKYMQWAGIALILASLVKANLVGLRGLEPPTLRLSGVRSNHLSYKPMKFRRRSSFSSSDALWWR